MMGKQPVANDSFKGTSGVGAADETYWCAPTQAALQTHRAFSQPASWPQANRVQHTIDDRVVSPLQRLRPICVAGVKLHLAPTAPPDDNA